MDLSVWATATKVQDPINFSNTQDRVWISKLLGEGQLCKTLHIFPKFSVHICLQSHNTISLSISITHHFGHKRQKFAYYLLHSTFSTYLTFSFHLCLILSTQQLINSSFHFNDPTPNSIPDQSHAPDSPDKLQLQGWVCVTELVHYVWSIHVLAFHSVTPDNLNPTKDVVSWTIRLDFEFRTLGTRDTGE